MRKFIVFSGILLLMMTTLAGCKKNEFGPKQTDFVEGSIYRAETDGFLTVHFKANGLGSDFNVKVYLDQSEDPITLSAEMGTTSSSTVTVRKNEYWKVVKGTLGTVRIEFTPFE